MLATLPSTYPAVVGALREASAELSLMELDQHFPQSTSETSGPIVEIRQRQGLLLCWQEIVIFKGLYGCSVAVYAAGRYEMCFP